ncbi:hypothetical protein UP10_15540 [Bradyrhizobium sp. LTSPM299]|uniref:hypothetical protein n=1 Tax=Bradyrhizobium sp. LTSPM299 TaxID=1619233 RepID=UPI0005C9B4EA|nr:hypothetical protein [Bradyrhizobium sp. LTSPM299]KJC60078.1 hypothetical protein UP10_15540 [Bradyrhizobium sp. LTSPM299]
MNFQQPARDSDRAPPYSFYVERLFDAVKQVGTANSSGLFGGLVAIYYFGAKSHDIMDLLKLITAVYLGGVFLFAFSYSSLASFFINQEPSLSGSPEYAPGPWRYILGLVFGAFSFAAWLIASAASGYVLFLL